jgi:hypothetical protein
MVDIGWNSSKHSPGHARQVSQGHFLVAGLGMGASGAELITNLDTIAGQGTKKCSLCRQWKMMSSGKDAGDAGPGEI